MENGANGGRDSSGFKIFKFVWPITSYAEVLSNKQSEFV